MQCQSKKCYLPLCEIVVACVVFVLACSPAWGQGALEIIARGGTTAPDGNGTTNFFGVPVLNNNGQAAFWFLLNNTNNGVDDDQGIFRGSTTPGSLTIIAKELQGAPGGGTYASFELTGTAGAINDNGAVTFRTPLIGTANNDGIFVGSGGPVTQIARINQAAPGGGTFSDFSVPFISRGGLGVDASGKVTFFGDNGVAGFIYSGSGGPTSRTTNITDTFWALHPSGHAAYREDGADKIFHANGGVQTKIVQLTQPAPDGNGRFQDFLDVAVNGSGQVAFASFMDNTAGGVLDDKGIFRGSGGAITQIMRAGQLAPVGSGTIDDFDGSQPAINASGRVSFNAILRGTAGGADDDTAIYRGSGGVLTQIAREDQAAPDGNGRFSDLSITNEGNFGYHAPAINDLGWVAFRANLRNTAAGTDDDAGLYVGDGFDVVQVARKGQTFDGATITSTPNFVSIPNEGRSGFNDSGQIALRFQTVDTSFNVETFITLWTPPDAQWVNGSGVWSDANHWDQGVTPKSLFHAFLNPVGGGTISGDFGSEHVRSLTLGGGTDVVTFSMQAGSILTVVDGLVAVMNNGVLTGGGTIDGFLANTPNGEVLATAGQQLTLTGRGNDNQGLVTLAGGALNFTQDFTNGGLVIGNGTLRAVGGIANNANMAFSATANLIGDVTNDTTGLITASGGTTTFFDDVVNNGTMEVDANSSMVFFGSFSGNGVGGDPSGTVTMRGDLKPGKSPGIVNFGGNLSFAPSASLQSELAGTDNTSAPNAPQFDRVNVTANVSVGGTLDIVLLNGFAPDYFAEFVVLTAGSRDGKFDQVTGTLIDPDKVLAPVYDYNGNTGLTLVAALPGDANLDGTVNGDDLLRWQANLFSGDEFIQGDFNIDGVVNGDDLLIWQAHLFDTVPVSVLATSSIPEPGTAVLLLGLGVLGVTMRRRVA